MVCDVVSLEFIKGSKIEFEDTLMRSAFVVRRSGHRGRTRLPGMFHVGQRGPSSHDMSARQPGAYLPRNKGFIIK